MSIQSNSLALHEILLSISDSLNKAQAQLQSAPAYDEYGRPNTIYHVPYLDFNLEVISEFSSPAGSSVLARAASAALSPEANASSSTTQLAQSSAGNYLKFVPFAATDYSKLSKNKITSTLSGRFVAVLPNDGLQQTFISVLTKQVETKTVDAVAFQVFVKLQNAAGDAIDGQRVEINFDKQNSLNLNSGKPFTSDPVFTSGKEGTTGSTKVPGEFSTTVELSKKDYESGLTFVFVANSGNLFSSTGISNTKLK